MMRRILLQYARRRRAAKRLAPPAEVLSSAENALSWEEILAVDQALNRLAQLSTQQARIAELRYFGGLSVEEAAEALDISPRTVKPRLGPRQRLAPRRTLRRTLRVNRPVSASGTNQMLTSASLTSPAVSKGVIGD